MMLVIASIGSEGLLGTEVLQSCLLHQLDLRTGQLWADGQSTLQLHQQRQAVRASALTYDSLVVPPDSEIMAPVSIRSHRIRQSQKITVCWMAVPWLTHQTGLQRFW